MLTSCSQNFQNFFFLSVWFWDMLAGEEGVNIQMNFPRKDIKIHFKILKNLFNTTSSLLESATALGGNKSPL